MARKQVLILLLAAMLAGGCTRNIYVPVERTRVDSTYSVRTRADTLLLRDSVFVAERGDTVIREVYRWRTRSRLRIDTLWKTRVDTVPVIVPAFADTAHKTTPWWKKLLKALVWCSRAAFLLILLRLAKKHLLSYILTWFKNII